MLSILCTLLLLCVSCQSFSPPKPPYPIYNHEIPAAFWEKKAREKFDAAGKLFPDLKNSTKQAKNVILFLGDGMGLPTISASRFYRSGKHATTNGIANMHGMEDWDFNTFCRTYDLETIVTDSASSATAYITGTKTRTGMLGLSGAVKVKQCTKYTDEEKLESYIKAAIKMGKKTGIVTTSRITHASPSGAFGHISFRDWEDDSKIKKECNTTDCVCTDLAYQVANDNLDVNIWLGGGQSHFFPNTETLVCDPKKKGNRLDKKNMMDVWLDKQKALGRKAITIKSSDEFRNVNFEEYDYVLGLPYASHFPYVLDQTKGQHVNLVDIAEAAFLSVKDSEKGFALFIEGARIDQAHHENRAQKSMEEMREFDEAIAKIVGMADLENTLIVVTADHSHSFGLVGQPSRFDSLFVNDKGKGPAALDKKGLIPAAYMNGPGAVIRGTRKNVSEISTDKLLDKDFMQQALVPNGWSTHGGEDVPVYAKGPFSHLFHTTVDNTFIAQGLKYAICAEPYQNEDHCGAKEAGKTDGAVKLSLFPSTIIFLAVLFGRQ